MVVLAQALVSSCISLSSYNQEKHKPASLSSSVHGTKENEPSRRNWECSGSGDSLYSAVGVTGSRIRKRLLSTTLTVASEMEREYVSCSPTPIQEEGPKQRRIKRVRYSQDVKISESSWSTDQSMVDSILWLFQKNNPEQSSRQCQQLVQSMLPISPIGGAPGRLLQTPLNEMIHANPPFVPERLAISGGFDTTTSRSLPTPNSTASSSVQQAVTTTTRSPTKQGKRPSSSPSRATSTGSVASRGTSSSNSKGHSSHKEAWDHHFQALVEFRKKHGHCRVPDRYPENPSLAGWVRRQRCDYQQREQEQLTLGSSPSPTSTFSSAVTRNEGGPNAVVRKARREALLDIGFDFDPQKTKWEDKFNQLVEYQRKHGHCKPTPRDDDTIELRQLANWVKAQRRHHNLFRQGKASPMTIGRIERLNSINFVWNPRQLQKQEQQMQQEHQQQM